ncbi:MAG: subclass B3 metallo-beta-lactamase [Sphingomonadales bacterium]|nr:subclass B3 metallo-beta-lactamase [Sphingomonadales bacterium]
MSGKCFLTLATLFLAAAAPPSEAASPAATTTIAAACGTRDGWSDPAPPAHIHGHTWYVGTCGITVVLVETRAGLALFDAGPEDAAPHILANIRALGFDPRQVKWIFSTHEHFDHAGGIASLQKATGARLAVGPFAARALRTGQTEADDPQATLLKAHPMQPARVDRVLPDGGSVVLGGTRFTARATPTHSSGSTSWTWRSCEDSQCLTIAYADSISTVSSDDYRFSDHPQRVEAARAGLRTIEALPCDVLLTPHPGPSSLLERLSGKEPLITPRACVAYALKGSNGLAARLAKEAASK